jgi:hypothetical protein
MDAIWNHVLQHTLRGDVTIGTLLTFAAYVLGGVYLFTFVLFCIEWIFPGERKQ